MYHVLILHDTEIPSPKGTLRWAHANRSLALQRYAPDDFTVHRAAVGEVDVDRLDQYDIVFNLDYASAREVRWMLRTAACGAWYVVSANRGINSEQPPNRQQLLRHARAAADWMIVNNLARYQDELPGKRICCISNGVDTQVYRMRMLLPERPEKVLWTGGLGPRKAKGYEDILLPAKKRLEELGFECDFRPVTKIVPEQVMTQEQMVRWYNSASYVVCTSKSEGTPNYLLEAMACGCVPVTTVVGNVVEFARIGRNANVVLIDRTVDDLVRGLLEARDRRLMLGLNAANTILSEWSYGPPANRAAYFFALFRALIERGPDNIEPFDYMSVKSSEI